MPRTRMNIFPHADYAELTQRYRRCRDVKERSRWLVIRLLSRPEKPMKVEQVAEITGRRCRDRSNSVCHSVNIQSPLLRH